MLLAYLYLFFFFFNDTATTEIYTLSLHDALPIWMVTVAPARLLVQPRGFILPLISRRSASTLSLWLAQSITNEPFFIDRKSTRLNSSHLVISYAVFCLKKKNNIQP